MTIISCRPLQYSGSTPDCGFGNPGSTPGKGIHFYTTNNVKERKRRKKKLFKYRKRQKEREREKEKPNHLNYLVFLYTRIYYNIHNIT